MSKHLLLGTKMVKPKFVRNFTMAQIRHRPGGGGIGKNQVQNSMSFPGKKKIKDLVYVENIEYKKYVRQVWNQFIERLYLGEVEKKKRKRRAYLLQKEFMRSQSIDQSGGGGGLASLLSTTSLLVPPQRKKMFGTTQNPNNLQEDIHEFGKRTYRKYRRFLRFVHGSAAKELFASTLRYVSSLLRIEKLKLRVRVMKMDLAKRVETCQNKAIGPKRRSILEGQKLLLRKHIQKDRSKLKKEKVQCLTLLKTCSACYSYVLVKENFSKVTEQVEEKKFFDALSFFLVHMVTIRIESKKLHPYVECEVQRLFKLNFFPTIEQNKRARKFLNLRELHKKKVEEYGRIKPLKHPVRAKQSPNHGKPFSAITKQSRPKKRPKTASGRIRSSSRIGMKEKTTSKSSLKRPKTSHGVKRHFQRTRGDYIAKGRDRLRFSYMTHKQHGGYVGFGCDRIKPELKMRYMFDRSPLVSVLYPRDEEKKFNVYNPFREEADAMLNLEEEKKQDPFVMTIPTKTLLAIGVEQEINLKEKKKKRRGNVVYNKRKF